MDVKSQVELACLGITQNVQNQQTKNGVKDAYTQFWIDDLIAHAQILHKNHPERLHLISRLNYSPGYMSMKVISIIHF